MQVRALMNYAYILKSERKVASTRATYDEALTLARTQVGDCVHPWGLCGACCVACRPRWRRWRAVQAVQLRRSTQLRCSTASSKWWVGSSPTVVLPTPMFCTALGTAWFSHFAPPAPCPPAMQHGATHGMVEKIKYELTAFLGTTGREVGPRVSFRAGRSSTGKGCRACLPTRLERGCLAGWLPACVAACAALRSSPPALTCRYVVCPALPQAEAANMLIASAAELLDEAERLAAEEAAKPAEEKEVRAGSGLAYVVVERHAARTHPHISVSSS